VTWKQIARSRRRRRMPEPTQTSFLPWQAQNQPFSHLWKDIQAAHPKEMSAPQGTWVASSALA
jgi:hypothetical protein